MHNDDFKRYQSKRRKWRLKNNKKWLKELQEDQEWLKEVKERIDANPVEKMRLIFGITGSGKTNAICNGIKKNTKKTKENQNGKSK
jgi:RNase adaptor protein for sRNA GlmZ degradation